MLLLPIWYFVNYQIERVNKIFAVYPAVVLDHFHVCTIHATQFELVYLVHMACI